MDEANAFLDAIEIIVQECVRKNTAIIDKGLCIGVIGNKCLIKLNGKTNEVAFYGSTPLANKVYPVFIPYGNMSNAFIINAR